MEWLPDDNALKQAGVLDPPRARRILSALPGQGVTDEDVEHLMPVLLAALKESPDPDRALNNFERWTRSVTSRTTHFRYLCGHPVALNLFFRVCGNSQLFSDILVRNPEYFEILARPEVRDLQRTPDALYRELSTYVDIVQNPQMKLDAMRRFKQREFLRIGARDLLGLADVSETAREFSHLADACVQKCLEISAAGIHQKFGMQHQGAAVPFVVVALGKHGGEELNYSSDIDIVFAYAEPSVPLPVPTADYANRLAEGIVQSLTQEMHSGRLFRVDVRLRPEGRFGALVRTLESYRAYWESWAEPWEVQVLLKARVVAGDPALGAEFTRAAQRVAYRPRISAEFAEAIRHNKRRIEQKAVMEGVEQTNVKIGRGGIRDIEFLVQLMQLQHGGKQPMLRCANTLEALALLRTAGLITPKEESELAEDYRWLRTVEHRLQLLFDLQTQNLPTKPEERALLARRLGYPDAEAFEADRRFRTERVHAHYARLFGDAGTHPPAENDILPLLDILSEPSAVEALTHRLQAMGFAEPKRAAADIRSASWGGDFGLADPETRAAFRGIAQNLLEECVRTGDPDTAFRGVELIAQSAPHRGSIYRALGESSELMHRLCVLSAAAPSAAAAIARHSEWLDLLVSEEVVDPDPKPLEVMTSELSARLRTALRRTSAGSAWESSSYWDALAHWIHRERLRITAREVWGESDAPSIGVELSDMAQVVLHSLVETARKCLVFDLSDPSAGAALQSAAVVGLGKLGGRELGFGSDWDILLVYQGAVGEVGTASPAATALTRLAEMLAAAPQRLAARGVTAEIDLRLRPEGRFGALVRTVDELTDYYRTSALTWERQVLTRSRVLFGASDTADLYRSLVKEVLFTRPASEETLAEIVAMKRRIETERLKPEERHRDLKLGFGGMMDIEFLVQALQMQLGSRLPQIRLPGTAAALRALSAVGHMPAPTARRLEETYALLARVRNRLHLRGVHADALPKEPSRMRPLALALGYADMADETGGQRLQRDLSERMEAARTEWQKFAEKFRKDPR
jgi:glutamate-ammonia-ligase adenylyltransferase